MAGTTFITAYHFTLAWLVPAKRVVVFVNAFGEGPIECFMFAAVCVLAAWVLKDEYDKLGVKV